MENVSQTAAKDVEIISVYPIMFVMLVRLIMDMDLTVQNADIVSHLTVDSVHWNMMNVVDVGTNTI